MTGPTLADFLLARLAETESDAAAMLLCDPHWALPARVLTDIGAKRQIVADCVGCIARWDDDPSCDGLAHYVLGMLALPYADHPDYQMDWRQ